MGSDVSVVVGGTAPDQDGHRFVVQRHRARRLHYDLRLEADGVLLSGRTNDELRSNPA